MKDKIKECGQTKTTISEMVLPNHTNNLNTLVMKEFIVTISPLYIGDLNVILSTEAVTAVFCVFL